MSGQDGEYVYDEAARLMANPEEIDCRYEGIKGLVLRTEFVRKR
tara:strand:- start:343 stop:474 length:132 start_codon:yes stop_codon:yes gene_type:complete